MMSRLRRILTVATLLSPVAGALHAQAAAAPPAGPSRTRLGAQVSYSFDGEIVGIGMRLQHSLSKLLGSPQVDGLAEINWFPETVDVFDLGYNVVYRFRSPNLKPYAGGGVVLLIASGSGQSDSDLNLNAMGGLEFKPLGRIAPFVQLRYVFAGQGDGLIMTGGFFF
jgi:hypothetical protein